MSGWLIVVGWLVQFFQDEQDEMSENYSKLYTKVNQDENISYSLSKKTKPKPIVTCAFFSLISKFVTLESIVACTEFKNRKTPGSIL